MRDLKNKLKSIPLVGTIGLKVYRTFVPSKVNNPSVWIKKYLKGSEATIIQIGSNDGKSGDPLFNLINHNKTWKAVFVEPVPYLFEQLKQNYGSNPRFTYENVAINDGKQQVFYAVSPAAKRKFPNRPKIDQIGSFDRNHILKHFNGQLAPFIDEIPLQGLSLSDLFSKNSIVSIDLLHIDTEGYDWNILSQLELDTFKPTLILFEHVHLKSSDKQASIEFLKDDYCIFEFRLDLLAIRKETIKKRDLNKIGINRIN